MKHRLLTTILAGLALSATASAATLDPNFPYEFLKKGNVIGFCPGVSIRVLSANAVGGRGLDGGAEMYNQAFFNADHSFMVCRPGGRTGDGPIERCDMRNNVPHQNIVNDLTAAMRSFDLTKQAFDPSLGQVVPQPGALAEQLSIDNGVVSVCVSRLDLENLTQDRAGAGKTDIQFDIAFKYSVSLDTDNGRQTFLIAELGAQRAVTSAFAEVYGSYKPRPVPFMANSWSDLQNKIGTDLKAIPNAEADQGLANVNSYLNQFFGPNGQ